VNARYENGVVTAHCSGCAAIATFERHHAPGGDWYPRVIKLGPFAHGAAHYERAVYGLLRCANCGRGALAVFLDQGPPYEAEGVLVDFYPYSVQRAPLPKGTPGDIVAEVREAERCAGNEAWRGASAMLRSALEKTFKANGYTAGTLAQKIDEAAADGVITAARAQRAHEEVRVLGNDILHDEWRAVDEAEYQLSHHYTQRVVEDFYDHRGETEAVLKRKGRLK
jgi:hypothetical protein